MSHKSIFIRSLVALLVVMLSLAQVVQVAAQTPTPAATATAEATAPVKPNIERAVTELNAKATSDPALDTLAQEIARRYGVALGAEYTEAQVFLIPATTAFSNVIVVYQAIFQEAGWQASQTAAEVAETDATAAWSDDSHVFLVYYQPAGQGEQAAVLVTVSMLAIPDLEGVETVNSDTNPELAAIADQVAKSIADKTGAETEVKIMTFPNTISIADVIAFYQAGMARVGWTPVDAFTQVTEGFSSMGWLEGNEMLFIFASRIAKDAAGDNMLLWIAARLPEGTPN